MMTYEEFTVENPDVIIFEEFKDAIIGYCERINLGPVITYDKDKIIEILASEMIVDENDLEEGQTIEDKKYELAVEYFDFNIIGGWLGEYTPIFITKFEQ